MDTEESCVAGKQENVFKLTNKNINECNSGLKLGIGHTDYRDNLLLILRFIKFREWVNKVYNYLKYILMGCINSKKVIVINTKPTEYTPEITDDKVKVTRLDLREVKSEF